MLFSALAVLFVATLAAKLIQIRRRTRRTLSALTTNEEYGYRGPVQLKVPSRGFRWSPKTIGGMELAVGRSTIEVATLPKAIGRTLGNQWYFRSAESRILDGTTVFDPFRSRWIVIEGILVTGETASVAVAPKRDFNATWTALISAGAQPAS